MCLGLHRNEAKAYKSLVTLGSASARIVAEESGVPRSKVYEVLYSLENKGMVRRVTGTEPAEFTPIDPEQAIDYLEEMMNQSAKSAKAILSELAKDKESDFEEMVWTLTGDEQIKMTIRSVIANAEREVFIATRDIGLLKSLKPSMAKAKQRGVETQLVSVGSSPELFEEFRHYLTFIDLGDMSSEDLIETLQKVINDPSLGATGWNPNEMSIIVVDNKESIGLFKSISETVKPWALYIRNPLIVIFQRQVIISLMAAIERLFLSQ